MKYKGRKCRNNINNPMSANREPGPPSFQDPYWLKTSSGFLELPGELRNIIYEFCFNIQYDADSSSYPRWSRLPTGLTNLLLVNKQVYHEASSMFYDDFFPLFEYLPVSFHQLYQFTMKVPPEHRGKFRAKISLLVLNGQEVLDRIGLVESLPWSGEGVVRKTDPPSRTVEKRLVGDCFVCTHFSSFGGSTQTRHDYDRITMLGHLGRLQWSEHRPVIVYRPPPAKHTSEVTGSSEVVVQGDAVE